MPKTPVVSGAEAVRAFERLGFRIVRQRGSHVVVRKDSSEGPMGTTIPMHDQIAIGTLKGMLRQAGVAPNDFWKALQ